ncbi:MAG: class I SAM-dependent methyltransferase [Pyrinomonadaceae bacterium]
MHEERLRQEFNEWAGAGRGASMERGHRPTGEQAIEFMSLAPDSRVLDLGCGNGWASRLIAAQVLEGKVIGIDVSDEMIALSQSETVALANVEFRVASAEALPFADGEFTHAFSMESIYYYGDMARALTEVRRVICPGGRFVAVVDLYQENKQSLQWVELLNVPVQALSIAQYHELFSAAGFLQVEDRRLLDPAPPPAEYTGTSFGSLAEFLEYREQGSLMISGRVA